mmetsp:Transcript_21795/g.63400  ORF Transcript_21795/g.63400 Transcript_21795/m.63400 type:complete len:173 (-) Transcript_21795:953-1471(-)
MDSSLCLLARWIAVSMGRDADGGSLPAALVPEAAGAVGAAGVLLARDFGSFGRVFLSFLSPLAVDLTEDRRAGPAAEEDPVFDARGFDVPLCPPEADAELVELGGFGAPELLPAFGTGVVPEEAGQGCVAASAGVRKVRFDLSVLGLKVNLSSSFTFSARAASIDCRRRCIQ